MLLRAYVPYAFTALFGGLFIALGIISFGEALIFDRLYIGVLIFTAFICRDDINVVGLLLIILALRLFEELLWITLQDVLWMKVLVYLCCAAFIYYVWYDNFAKVAAVAVGLSVLAEIYWLVTDYARTPEIYWYNAMILLNLVVRFLLFSRIELTERLFNKQAESTNLDWAIYQFTRLYIAVNFLNLLEYFVRHILMISDITYVHTAFPYIMHILAILVLWIVSNEFSKKLSARLLRA